MMDAFARLLIGITLLSCSAAAKKQKSVESDSSLQQISTGKTYWDTHGNYAHTKVVDLKKFTYFKKVNDKNAVILTLDCAWVEQQKGLEIIDALKSHNIKTTFFISGPFIFKNRKLGRKGGLKTENFSMIKRLVDDGHEFGNHSVNHPHNSSVIDWNWEIAELARGWEEVVQTIYQGAAPANAELKPYWRAPYGEYDSRSLRQAAANGFPHHFGWNVDTRDTTGLPACSTGKSNCMSAYKMTQYVIDFAERNRHQVPAIVILAHLSNPYRYGASPEGLTRLVNYFRGKNYVFSTLSESYVRAL